MREDTKTITFAAVVCVTCSLLLSGTAAGLKSMQEANKAFDVKRNIVKAFGYGFDVVEEKKIDWSREKFEATFEQHIKKEGTDKLPLFTWTDDGADKPSKYAFPISGKGLWSTLYGYLALNADLETIAGISFYKHGETPGLGAEIEKDKFLTQFKGKRLYSDGAPINFKVTKPGYAKGESAVNGISGATLTGNGVEALIRKDAEQYANYFNNIKGN